MSPDDEPNTFDVIVALIVLVLFVAMIAGAIFTPDYHPEPVDLTSAKVFATV